MNVYITGGSFGGGRFTYRQRSSRNSQECEAPEKCYGLV
jgi:hypothetical protein